MIEDYLKRSGLDIIPDHEVDNTTHAVSMIASTGAVALLPLYPNNLLPWSVTSRPIRGDAPTIRLGCRLQQGEQIADPEVVPFES